MRVRIDSIGCRLNIGEADHLARTLARRGHRVVGPGEAADVMLLNTCAVTHVAARKSRKLIRHWRRNHPHASLVVTGCYSELSPDETAALGVDLIVANADKDGVADLLERAGILKPTQLLADPGDSPLAIDSCGSGGVAGGRTRAFVKVQDGCDNRCTFCIVTVARGDSRSRSVADVVGEVQELVGLGYQEAVLTGVHLGSYGHDRSDSVGLTQLVRTVLAETAIPRLRLSSLEPWDLDSDFFSLWAHDRRLLPHVHLPLQSGCDETLRRMARRTDQRSFRALVRDARAAVPDLAVTTDIIVGFPGETDAEFEQSIDFVAELEFAKLHVFRYSARAETAAASMPDHVHPAVAQERSQRMHALGAEMESAFRRRFIGTTAAVLWETSEPRPEGMQWSGLAANYLRVVTTTAGDADLHNVVTETRLVGVVPGAVEGIPRQLAQQ